MKKNCINTIWNPVGYAGKKWRKRWASGILAAILTVSGVAVGYPMEAYADPAPQKITGYEPNMTVDLGRKPELPESVTLEYSDGRTVKEPVEWEYVSAGELSEPFMTKTVEGTLTNFPDMTISTTLEVIPKDLKYFIDCGTGDWGVTSAKAR